MMKELGLAAKEDNLPSMTCQKDSQRQTKEMEYQPTPVCVHTPSLFIVSNSSLEDYYNETCFYTQCWDASQFPQALVVRIPQWIPVPVEAPKAMSLFRQKRDFGITAAIIGAIALAAAGVATAAVAMTPTVLTAQTLNNLSPNVAQALDIQKNINAQLKGGLMVTNQRIDLVQEQIETLWQLAQIGCEWKYPGLCITSIQYENFTRVANLSKQLSRYLTGNWSGQFDAMVDELRLVIVAVNSTRVDPGIAEGLSSWMNHLKEWAGIGALVGLLAFASLVCLWCICRIRVSQHHNAAMIIQALTAIEAGQSPQDWLATLKNYQAQGARLVHCT
ncbi:hypothetical protein STEG23_015479 [Scotinomys teguina]